MKNPPTLNPGSQPADGPVLDTTEDSHRASARLMAEAAFVRAAIGSKRSDKLLRVFDFLLERTVQGRPPSEVEIAEEAFSIGKTLDVSQDATVRVYVHRLRKALDGIYTGKPGPRLLIPRGEYRIVLAEEGATQEGPEAAPDIRAVVPVRRWRWLWLGLMLLVLVNVAAWWKVVSQRPHDEAPGLARTALWSQLAQSKRPITVVLGDYYWFAESSGKVEGQSTPLRLVRDPSINAREDLDFYLMAHPEQTGRVADLDLRYVPSSAVIALGEVFTAVNAIRTDQSRRLDLVPVSRLTADILKSSDIVYVGQLSGLGTLLRNPLFQASGFQVGASYDELLDTASGQRYQSDGGMLVADERIARRDYGYIASLPGPSSNHIIVIAGTRDAALLQMAEMANDEEKLLASRRGRVASPEGFEALYQVRTMGNLNLSGKLLMERPLRSSGIWDKSKPTQRFPNDTYEGGGHAD